jgi:hypothetical protein
MTDAGAAGGDSAEKKKGRKATAGDHLGPKIMLDGQPATGLFVLFAPAMPKADKNDPNGKILAAAGSKVPPAQFTLCFVDGQGYLQKLDDGVNPWHEIAAQLENIDHQTSGGRRKGASKPVFATVACANPHMEKLTEGATYQFCLVGHPNPVVAIAMRDYLNGGKKDDRFIFPDDKAALVFEAPVATDTCEGGKTAHVDLPTDPTQYWPAGAAVYGGWVLYRDMPYAHLDSVKTAIQSLACDLASLRYPTGESSTVPYPSSPSEHSGHFGTVLMAATHAFQKDAATGNAFQIFPAVVPATTGTNKVQASWAYLLGELKKSDEAKTQPDLGVGVVTQAVADAIGAWKAGGLRKPGAILIRSNLQSERWGRQEEYWGRQEMMFALCLWDLMAKALGCTYGIRMNCTFRELTVPKATGRVECSNHKLGLSVDLRMQKYRYAASDWPVRFEADWCPSTAAVTKKAEAAVDKAQKGVTKADTALAKSQADLAKLQASASAGKAVPSALVDRAQAGETKAEETDQAAHDALTEAQAAQADLAEKAKAAKANYQLLWRIYGHTSFPAFAERKEDGQDPPATGAADLQAALSAPECLGVQATGPWGIETRVIKTLTGSFPTVKTPDVDTAMRALCAPSLKDVRNLGEQLLTLAGTDGKGGLVDSYFRWAVRQFDYNPYESDGGTSGPPVEAVADSARASNVQPVRCWLNLTRLGFDCGMNRIAAQRGIATGTIKKPDRDPEFPGVQPADEPFSFAEGEAKEVGPMLAHLASRLDDLRAAPEHWPIKVRLQDGTEKEVHAEDFDVEFIREWGKLVGTPKSEFTFEGVGLVFPFTYDIKTLKTRLATFAAVEQKIFSLAWAGAKLKMQSAVGTNKKLGDWMGDLDNLASESPEDEEKTAFSQRKTDREWSLFFMPLLVSSPAVVGPAAATSLPSAGSPQPLEWWHHDNKAMDGKDWGELAVEIGYSNAVVTAENKAASTITDGMCQRGLGFPRDRVERTRNISATPPENRSEIPEGG